MSRSRARLAADWFAKLRQNAVTNEVEHTDVVAAEAIAAAEATAVEAAMQASLDVIASQTITLSGDATGSGSTSISVTVADDSHNHVWGNIDGASVGAKGGPRFTTGSGWIEFGPANTSWAHIDTDRPNFYFYKPLYVLGTPVLTGSGVPSTSASTAGTVGSYAFLRAKTSSTITYPNNTVAGSTMSYTDADWNQYGTPGGTWRCMSYAVARTRPTVYMRIS